MRSVSEGLRLLPDIVRVLGHQVLHERSNWGFELESSCGGPLEVNFSWVSLRKENLYQAVIGFVHGLG